METRNVRYLGWECVELSNGKLTLRVTQSLGPRVIYLALNGQSNLLAELPDFVIPEPVGPYRLLGGHRLWYGPEDRRSYLPDDKDPVEITPIAGGVQVVQKTDAAGMQKQLDIILDPVEAKVTVTQRLVNHGWWAVQTYPWGLTQVRPGGWAILPQWTKPLDRYALISNRALILWPYTRISDPRLHLGDRYLFVHADPQVATSFKIGYANLRGWLGYWIDGMLFVKKVPYDPCGVYPDMGCSSEIYTNDRFLEVEALAPLTTVEPEGTASLTETWYLYRDVLFAPAEDAAERMAEQLGLDAI